LAARAVLLGRVGQLLGDLGGVQPPLDLAQIVDLGPGLRPPRCKQRAAVLVGELGDGQRAQAARLGHDLGLVPAEQRAQDRQLDRVVEGGDVRQGLAGHLAQGVAGHQRVGVQAGGERLGRLEHQPPLRDHLEAAGARAGE
jgi:hypothetical protein